MKKGVWNMKKGLLLFLAMLLLSCTFTVYAADLPINDASKWTPSFTGEREYKTPDQSVKAISNGVEFTGIGGERENFTYGFTQPLNFPKEDLTIEFTLKEGFEEEMLFAFALMDKPNWGSWYSNNDSTGMIFNVRPNNRTEFAMAPALDWPVEVPLNWPENEAAVGAPTTAVKDKLMKFEFKHTATSMKLIVNGVEMTEFEKKFSDFYLDSLLKDGKCYLTVSGLNYTFDPELRSTLQVHKVSTTPSSFANANNSGTSTSSKQNTTGPVIDVDIDDDPTTSDVDSTSIDIDGTESSIDSTSEPDSETNDSSALETSSSKDASAPAKSHSLIWLWIVLAVVVVVGGGGAAVYFLVIKKKKDASTDANENK